MSEALKVRALQTGPSLCQALPGAWILTLQIPKMPPKLPGGTAEHGRVPARLARRFSNACSMQKCHPNTQHTYPKQKRRNSPPHTLQQPRRVTAAPGRPLARETSQQHPGQTPGAASELKIRKLKTFTTEVILILQQQV